MTTIIIAQRISSIMDADKIIVMKGGKLVETGTHEALLAKGGYYSELYNSQFENCE
jgi:ATP-binding cassette subfamily B protein